jgi:hypothetical protein
MSKNSHLIFKGLKIVSWIIFVGLCIEAGALLVNFVISLFKPEIIKNLYQKLDLSDLYMLNKWAYFGLYTFMLLIAILKAFLFFLVIDLLSKLDLTKPFSAFVSKQITRISYCTLSIGILGYVAQESIKPFSEANLDLNSLDRFWPDSQAFILMAAVIYVIAQIFAKGVELQTENELTV